MKLLYVANARIPTEKAHGLQISKMCESYADLGHCVSLVVPDRMNQHNKNLFSYYQISEMFSVSYLKIPIQIHPTSRYSHRVIELQFILHLKKFLKSCVSDAIITRDIFCVLFFAKGNNVYYEMHDFPERNIFIWRFILKKPKGIIVTNRWKKEVLVNQFQIDQDTITVAPNGFDPEIFSPIKEGLSITREQLSIENNDYILCYTGSLKTMSMDKGVGCIIQALTNMPQNVKLLLVGGAPEDISEYKKKVADLKLNKRVCFVSRVPHNQMPEYMRLADAFVAPFPDTPHYRHYMSPIKLFEYMAMKKPIFSSDLDSIKEIVGDAVVFFAPGDPDSLAFAIKKILDKPEIGTQISEEAYSKVQDYTWSNRAQNILSFIERRNESV